MKTITKSYSEMILLPTFLERFEYLRLHGGVAHETFGRDRWINQLLYTSPEWKAFRNRVIRRDEGCDLACPDRPIQTRDPVTGRHLRSILIHHINPITYEDVVNQAPCVFSMDNAVCTQLLTHNAIHYGDDSLLIKDPVERTVNDTCPWKL